MSDRERELEAALRQGLLLVEQYPPKAPLDTKGWIAKAYAVLDGKGFPEPWSPGRELAALREVAEKARINQGAQANADACSPINECHSDCCDVAREASEELDTALLNLDAVRKGTP